MLIRNHSVSDPAWVEALTLVNVLVEHGFGLVQLHGINPATGCCTCTAGTQCTAAGKHPVRKGWQKRLIASEAGVVDFFRSSLTELPKEVGQHTHYMSSNLGVVCGTSSRKHPDKYLVIVDIDNNDQMIEALDACKEKTVNYYTGSGGKHYLFLTDHAVRNSVSAIAPGVDIRGVGGYAVIPPSSNAKGDYGRIAPERIIRELPEFLRQSIATCHQTAARKKPTNSDDRRKAKLSKEEQEATKAATEHVVNRLLSPGNVETIPCGVRNQTLFIHLSRLRAGGALKGALFDVAREFIATRFEKPETFSEAELTQLVTSVARYKPTVQTHDETLRVFVEWATRKNKSIPAIYGKNIFQFTKDIYRYDREFYQEYLPNKIRENIRTLGVSLTMAEVETVRADYYTNLGLETCHYPRYPDTLIGKFFKNEYPFYKVYDKVRKGVRRYEWFIEEKAYDDYLSGHRRERRHTVETPEQQPPPATKSDKGKQASKEQPTANLSNNSLLTPDAGLPWGLLPIGTNERTGSYYSNSIVSNVSNIPPYPQTSPASPGGELAGSGVGVGWVQGGERGFHGQLGEQAAHSLAFRRDDLTTVAGCAKVGLQRSHGGFEVATEGTITNHAEDNGMFERSPHRHWLTTLASGYPGCCGGTARRVCTVNLRGATLLQVRPATNGSRFAAAGDWSSLQCVDNKAGGVSKDPGKLSARHSHRVSSQGDELGYSRSAELRTDHGCFERCRRPCVRKRSACGSG